MNRRSFLAALGLAPVMPVAALAAQAETSTFEPADLTGFEDWQWTYPPLGPVGSVTYIECPVLRMDYYPSVYQGSGRLHRCFDYAADSFCEPF